MRDPGERPGAGAELGDALMVLEAGEPRHAERRIDVGDELADAAPVAAAAGDVEDAEARHRLALDAAEPVAEHLIARADREHHRAAGWPPPPGRRRLAAGSRPGSAAGPRRRRAGRCRPGGGTGWSELTSIGLDLDARAAGRAG